MKSNETTHWFIIVWQEYERERDQCPMHFDDGSNPWVQTENFVKVFRFGNGHFSLLVVVPLIAMLYFKNV